MTNNDKDPHEVIMTYMEILLKMLDVLPFFNN